MKFLARVIALLLLATISSFAASTSPKAGMDPAKLAEIPKRMQPFVDSNIISGAVTIGTGSGSGAFLAPNVASNQPAILTCQNTLTFKADSTYSYKLNTRNGRADQVRAKGVTIESGAQFDFNAVANKRLTTGTVFTAISNTSATQISGTFANLPDNSTFTVGRNNYQVSYEGGDGNDLTLTVQ